MFNKVAEQGDLVRKLKTDKADKSQVDAAVKVSKIYTSSFHYKIKTQGKIM